MSSLTHTSTANIGARVAYLSRDNNERFSKLIHSTTGAHATNDIIQDIISIQREHNAVRKPTLHEVMVSFPAAECCPENTARIQQSVMELAAELVGNREFFIFEHIRRTDGRREYHIAIVPPDLSTGKVFSCSHWGGEIRRDGKGRWQQINDRILRKNGLGYIQQTANEQLLHCEAESIQRRGVIPPTLQRRRDIRNLIRSELRNADSVDDLMRRCAVKVQRRGDNLTIRRGDKVISFLMSSWGSTARPVRLNRIDRRWTVAGLTAIIARRQGKPLKAVHPHRIKQAIEHISAIKPPILPDQNAAHAWAQQVAAEKVQEYDHLGIIDKIILEQRIADELATKAVMNQQTRLLMDAIRRQLTEEHDGRREHDTIYSYRRSDGTMERVSRSYAQRLNGIADRRAAKKRKRFIRAAAPRQRVKSTLQQLPVSRRERGIEFGR